MIDVGRTYCTKSIHFKQFFQDLMSMLDYNGSCLLL